MVIIGIGGLSYLSTQYGWAMNNVDSFEIVLANGAVVTASADENKDLFQVLKGGGNNFGIVTTYTLYTHPIGTVSLPNPLPHPHSLLTRITGLGRQLNIRLR